ncbi:MAG: hypothetical protein LBR36_04135 [Bacteroidales bacterium]|jgi:hypothetical protein|nr:hypothetical protein [Bacteroidales bacterium]
MNIFFVASGVHLRGVWERVRMAQAKIKNGILSCILIICISVVGIAQSIPVAFLPTDFSGIVQGNEIVFTWSCDVVMGGSAIPSFLEYSIVQNHYQGSASTVIYPLSPTAVQFVLSDVPAGTNNYCIKTVYKGEEYFSDTVQITVNQVFDYANIMFFNANVYQNQVVLEWGIENEGEIPVQFILQRENEIITQLNGSTFFYLDADLDLDDYHYTLCAVYSDENTFCWADDILVTVSEISPVVEYNLPYRFSHFIFNDNVLITWDLMPNNGIYQPQFYTIYRNGSMIAELPADVRLYADTNIDKDVLYTYQLSVTFDNGTMLTLEEAVGVIVDNEPDISAFEGEIIMLNIDDGVSSIALPPDSVVAVIEGYNVHLQWFMNERAIEPQLFVVERNGDVIFEGGNGTREYIDAELEEGTYYYKVKAKVDVEKVDFLEAELVCITIKYCE